MRNVIYTVIFLLVLFTLFKGVIFDLAEGFGLELLTGENVFISKDGGLSWQTGGIKNNISGNIKLDRESPGNLIQASSAGILKIKDLNEKNHLEDKERKNLGYIFDFFQDQEDPQKIYLISHNIEGDKILLSENKGKSFKTIFKLNSNDKITAFYKINNSFFIGTKKGAFIESNNGLSWKEIKSFSPQSIISIAKNIKENEVYLVLSAATINLIGTKPPQSFNSQVYIYKNNEYLPLKELEGKNIQKVKVNQLSGDVFFVSDTEIYLYQNKKISKINLISDFKIYAFTFDPKNPNILYIGGKNLLYRSRDKGATWEIIDLPTNVRRIKEIEIDSSNSNIILIKTTE